MSQFPTLFDPPPQPTLFEKPGPPEPGTHKSDPVSEPEHAGTPGDDDGTGNKPGNEPVPGDED